MKCSWPMGLQLRTWDAYYLWLIKWWLDHLSLSYMQVVWPLALLVPSKHLFTEDATSSNLGAMSFLKCMFIFLRIWTLSLSLSLSSHIIISLTHINFHFFLLCISCQVGFLSVLFFDHFLIDSNNNQSKDT